MALLTTVSLSRKLPVIIAALCISASVSIAVVGYLDFNKNINQEVRENFRVLTESRGLRCRHGLITLKKMLYLSGLIRRLLRLRRRLQVHMI